jgi:hypothetical protein
MPIIMPIIKAQPLLSQHDLIFNTSLLYETRSIDLKLVRFKLQAEVNIGPQFTLTSSQNLRDAGTPDTITVSLSPKSFIGDLTLRVVDEAGKVLASQSIPFKIDKSPLGKTGIPLPEVGVTIIMEVVTISPRLIIESSLDSEVEVEGPATTSIDSLQWSSEGQRTISVNF